MKLQEEQKIIELAKKDIKQLEPIFNTYYPELYKYAYSIIKNTDDANDVVQKAFLIFIEKIQSYEWKGISVKFWLIRSVRNFCYKEFNLGQKVENIPDSNEVYDEHQISFVDEIIQKDLINLVKNELDLLSLIEKETIVLKIWEELTFEEIASIQNSTLSGVKARFYRAIEKIKTKMNEKEKIKLNGISLPMLFTAIKAVGSSKEYIPDAVVFKNILKKINEMNTTVNKNLGQFLTSKAGIAVIAGVVALTAITGGIVSYLASQKASKDDTKVVEVTPTPTVEVTESPVVTATEEPTSEPTSAPITWQKYTIDADKGVYMEVPSNWTRNKFEYNPMKSLVIEFKDKNGNIFGYTSTYVETYGVVPTCLENYSTKSFMLIPVDGLTKGYGLLAQNNSGNQYVLNTVWNATVDDGCTYDFNKVNGIAYMYANGDPGNAYIELQNKDAGSLKDMSDIYMRNLQNRYAFTNLYK